MAIIFSLMMNARELKLDLADRAHNFCERYLVAEDPDAIISEERRTVLVDSFAFSNKREAKEYERQFNEWAWLNQGSRYAKLIRHSSRAFEVQIRQRKRGDA